jgi:hypothetical protein
MVWLGCLAGAMVATVVWAQVYESPVEYIAQEKVNDRTKAWIYVQREVSRTIDVWTTITATQKSDFKTKLSEAVCSGTTPANIASRLTTQERTNVGPIWNGIVDEWRAFENANTTAQTNKSEDVF